MKNGVHLPPKQHDVIQHLLQQRKRKKLKTKTTDAPRKMHNA
jgi:hypothetical protein